ncbi:hypothetical protein [Thalassoroseus pseudoceratinae]|uniref:hypothetical protein n=1 Tax=Thalassoroseus pseudoceratinae TaxID=2713176 RepID=UPI00141FB331|nr:hypothetical protein [Thalassoroseus pseudoceratinae]
MRQFVIVLGLVVGTTGLVSIAWTQEVTTKKPVVSSNAKTLPPGAERTKSGKIVFRGRLPNGWGKLGILYDQKQTIYKVQAQYNAEIDELEAQIEKLKAERDAAMRDALTDAQRKKLDDALSSK